MQLNKQYDVLNASLPIFFLKLGGSKTGLRLIDSPNYWVYVVSDFFFSFFFFKQIKEQRLPRSRKNDIQRGGCAQCVLTVPCDIVSIDVVC